MKKKSKAGRPRKFKEKTTTLSFRVPKSRAKSVKILIDAEVLRIEKESNNVDGI